MTPGQVAARLALAELELQVKGHSLIDARAATKRAAGYALGLAGHVRPQLREAVFEDLLARQLAGSDAWLKGVEEARARGDYRRGLERAIATGRYADGVERFLGAPTSKAEAWQAAAETAAQAWEQL